MCGGGDRSDRGQGFVGSDFFYNFTTSFYLICYKYLNMAPIEVKQNSCWATIRWLNSSVSKTSRRWLSDDIDTAELKIFVVQCTLHKCLASCCLWIPALHVQFPRRCGQSQPAGRSLYAREPASHWSAGIFKAGYAKVFSFATATTQQRKKASVTRKIWKLLSPWFLNGVAHRRSTYKEEKGKVVAALWGTELSKFFAAL